MRIAALFVANPGVYIGLPDVDPWDKNRDARCYDRDYPVVAHPPCQLWTRFAHVNFARWGGEHNRSGNDGGCFKSALTSLHRCGGVLEHPAFSDAWKMYDLPRPDKSIIGWQKSTGIFWVCEVWQSAYGHAARKKTWLLYRGNRVPADLSWEKREGTHQIGFHDQRGKERNKPTISGKRASATPLLFRDALIKLAKNCH